MIGIVGGTGPAGIGLATRLALAGHDTLIGSRDPQRAAEAAQRIQGRLGAAAGRLLGLSNAEAARCDCVVLAVNAEHTAAEARALAPQFDRSIVVCMAAQVERHGRGFVAHLPSAGSIAQDVAEILPGCRVIAAFHHLPAVALGDLDTAPTADVLVCGDDREAVASVIDRFDCVTTGRLLDAGALANAAALEAMTAVLLTLNSRSGGSASVLIADQS